jgi:hypothetical protein
MSLFAMSECRSLRAAARAQPQKPNAWIFLSASLIRSPDYGPKVLFAGLSRAADRRLSAPTRRGRKETVGPRLLDGLSAAVRAELCIEVGDVSVDCVHRNVELAGDLWL